MISQSLKGWQRIEYENTPIYLQPERPDWFVPNKAADHELLEWLENGKANKNVDSLLKRIDGMAGRDYQSRSDQLKLDSLKECWIHVTNQCNMQCKHCMFKSSPRSNEALSQEDCDRIIREAYSLGCKIFFFTGGEPLLSKVFLKSLQDILQLSGTHVVVLSNLSLLSRVKEMFRELPRDRLHFQVSLDGLQRSHDALRGPNAFDRLIMDLQTLRKLGFPVTLSTTVTRQNVDEMEGIVDLASRQQVSNLHFLWLFKKGNADNKLFVEPDRIFRQLTTAQERGEKLGVKIDNIESLKSQVFSCPGTRYDLNNAGWQSLAVGPDGHIYPTPALIYTEGMQCAHIREGLEQVWKNSPVLDTIRRASLNDSDAYRANPLRYITGGGDIDHSFIHSGRITGGDPYVELYSSIARWLIAREARLYNSKGYPAIKLKMGEKLGECPAEGNDIFFTHSNCVLSLPGHDTHTQVNRFYSEAARNIKEDILNPICYQESLISHIPEDMRYRSYGCGSPVIEAEIQQGESVADLGSGTGIECFIASKLTGPEGLVVGVDMGDTMLGIANRTKAYVAQNLQYDNIDFMQAYLEFLPLDDSSVDVVISNCVVNLSPDKRRVFQEIYRILKPNGRLVISDISYNQRIPLEIKYNEKLRGECIGGALSYYDLFGLLNDLGFSDNRVLKGYLYRTVKEYDFYSLTYQAYKRPHNQQPVQYEFPDFERVMAAVEVESTCTCFEAPGEKAADMVPGPEPHRAGCMICGAELLYHSTDQNSKCHYCGQVKPANARCAQGHFVCDQCHSTDAVEIVKQVCLHSKESDAVTLMQTIRSHPHFRVHGPEHHALVPAVILAALKNSGVPISGEQIQTAIQRGQTIAGGACAFLGICGAAIGVGIAFSVLMGANPYQADNRQFVQKITQEVLETISAYKAPRCCQRDAWLALQKASELLKGKMGIQLTVNRVIACKQFSENKECIHKQCPLWIGK